MSGPDEDSSMGTYALCIVFQCELRPLLEDLLEAEHVCVILNWLMRMAPSCSSLIRVASTT